MSAGTVGSKVNSALATLWRKHRQTNFERIELLERAAGGLLRGHLDEDLRGQAERAAHQLAGSLGTFGFDAAARWALQAESLLRAATLDARRLAEAVVALRASVEDTRPEQRQPDRPHPGEPPAGSPAGSPACCAGGQAAAGGEAGDDSAAEGAVLLLVATDADLISRYTLDCGRAGLRLRVSGYPPTADELGRDRSPRVDAVLVDLGDDLGKGTGTDIEDLAELAERVPVFVLAGSDSVADRIAVARRGVGGYLPRAQPARESVAFVARTLDRQAGAATAVLAVDDDPGLLDALATVLSGSVARLVTVTDPLRFWDALDEVRPQLALIDIDMPGVSGLELCRMVRADPRWHGLPVIIVTAQTSPAALSRAFAAGADDYVTKSMIAVELPPRVRAHAERARLLRSFAEVDPVTGVENRRTVERSLERLIRQARAGNERLCVVRIDVDDFSSVNDREGHAVGDAVLRRLGDLLRAHFPPDAAVGRWADDEFIVGVPGVDGAVAAERVARLYEALAAETVAGMTGEPVRVGFSAGVAALPEEGTRLVTLGRAADLALRRAKSTGGRVMTASQALDEGAAGVTDVIVVEDDDSVADVIEQALRLRGHEVVRLADGAEAAERIGAGEVRGRMILLDISLPGLDGFGVLRALGERGVLRHTPVIVLTARSSEAEKLRALGLGASDHIAKPFSVPVLVRRVQQVLARPG